MDSDKEIKIEIEFDGLDDIKEKVDQLHKTAAELISLAEDIKTTTISVKPHVI